MKVTIEATLDLDNTDLRAMRAAVNAQIAVETELHKGGDKHASARRFVWLNLKALLNDIAGQARATHPSADWQEPRMLQI